MSTNLLHSSSSGEMSYRDKDHVVFTSEYNKAVIEYNVKMRHMSTETILIIANAICVTFGVDRDDTKKACFNCRRISRCTFGDHRDNAFYVAEVANSVDTTDAYSKHF